MHVKRSSSALRIAHVAPLWSRVPPTSYGGIERVVHFLAERMVECGHDVTLFASADSTTSARLRGTYPCALAEAMGRLEAFSYDGYINSSIADVLAASDCFDIIHFNVGAISIPFASVSNAATLHTIQSDLTLDDCWILDRYPSANVTALTHQQLRAVEANRRESIKVVPSGFDFGQYHLSRDAGRYLAFLGRMAPHKGPEEAIRIARAAGRPIVLAGAPMTQDEKQYFDAVVRPLLDDADVSYIGPVNDEQKDGLFRGATALLFPIKWDEPFGLVMIEAMACGVPVIACKRGSVPEIVEFGTTGFYAEEIADLAGFVDRASALDRAAVREHAKRRFCYRRMTDDYLAIYEELLR